MKTIIFMLLAIFLFNGCATWQGIKKDSASLWEVTQNKSGEAWDATKKGTNKAYDSTKETIEEMNK